jgi:mannose-1-phosphate guanylyltransferase
MKALLLAAGKGSRLKQLTETLPKPMLPFQGKPLLEYNIELCKKYDITNLCINTHHLPEKIIDHFKDGAKFGVKIEYSFEKELLGTSGALQRFRKELSTEPFFVIYGDNITNFDFNLLREQHAKTSSIATIGLHYREDIENCGVVELDKENKITFFLEKPPREATLSRWVNAGVYLLSPKIFDHIPEGFSDFGKDIFPSLLKKKISMYGVCSHTKVFAFDTEELIEKSEKEK